MIELDFNLAPPLDWYKYPTHESLRAKEENDMPRPRGYTLSGLIDQAQLLINGPVEFSPVENIDYSEIRTRTYPNLKAENPARQDGHVYKSRVNDAEIDEMRFILHALHIALLRISGTPREKASQRALLNRRINMAYEAARTNNLPLGAKEWPT